MKGSEMGQQKPKSYKNHQITIKEGRREGITRSVLKIVQTPWKSLSSGLTNSDRLVYWPIWYPDYQNRGSEWRNQQPWSFSIDFNSLWPIGRTIITPENREMSRDRNGVPEVAELYNLDIRQTQTNKYEEENYG